MELTDYNEIQALLRRHGFRFSKSMGQNFLIEPWVPERIADSARLDKDTAVLEIGPGVGCLTEQLSRRAGKVLAVELDRSLEGVLRETLGGCDNVEVLFGDILRQDIPTLVREHFGGMRAVVCANLPYNVTSPLLTALLKAGCFDILTVMIQREVARRICAAPDTADYGAFSLFVQWHAECELLFDVPPHCFHPQAAFNQRRKTLPNALSAGLGLPRSEIEQVMESCALDPRIRGEALDLGAFVQITDALAAKLQNNKANL